MPIRFSIIIWTNHTNGMFFRNNLDALQAMDAESTEIIIVDENAQSRIAEIAGEFFPQDSRLHYYRIRRGRGMGYAYNMGIHYARGEYFVFIGQHDRISGRALTHYDNIIRDASPDAIYCDHDELENGERTNPIFKPGLNKELLRHVNYIGNHLVIKREVFMRTGLFRENLPVACMYDLLLRMTEKKCRIHHVPMLFYHIQKESEHLFDASYKKIRERAYKEHTVVVAAHFKRQGIDAEVLHDRRMDFWKIRYDGHEYKAHRREYVLLREKKHHPITRRSLERLYGHIKQPDVAVVGVAMLKNRFTFDNCGYIFDREGFAYPACHGHHILYEGYMGRNVLAQDVSMVDMAYCLIDKKIYRKLGGFDPELVGRDRMLDFCFRARRAGFRIVFEPQVKVLKRERENVSSAQSNALLIERWGDVIEAGDPYYNENLPMGLENYIF